MRTIRRLSWVWALVVLVAACGNDGGSGPVVPAVQCADVVEVDVELEGDGAFRFAVTVRSDDSGWDGYADRWEVLVDDEVVGTRELAHPHVDEQPFTRSQAGIEVSAGMVVVRAHHSTGGFCGAALGVALPAG